MVSRESPAASRNLREYRRKRSFDVTPEPRGDGAGEERTGKEHAQGRPGRKSTDQKRSGEGLQAGEGVRARFVVHEHHARRLHWDLRLEHEGALASWAVPNGIPTDPRHNRKAIHVEDHPLDYLDFAGTIPAGNYGAGEVSVWDRGTYACEKWQADKVVVVFAGERLQGRYALFHAGREEKDWMIHRMDPPQDPTAQDMPEWVEPMLARPSTLPADESPWAFEVKWDGVRAIAYSQPGRLRLASRRGNDITAAYPELRGLNRTLGSHEAILDGEVVAFDEHGRPSFEALQPRMHLRGETVVRRRAAAAPVTYVLFDLLWLDGHSLIDLPYGERRERLLALELDGEHWRVPMVHIGEGASLLAATRERGMEGVIAKRLDSRYAPGQRSASWLKIKHSHRQEVLIGGWTEGRGARAASIGALQTGAYDERGQLRYTGRVGTGFDEQTLTQLARLLRPLAREDSPFVGRQPPRGAHHFVEPQLVCEVEFTEWTRDGLMRHPSYKGLREDKPAAEVIRERVQPAEVLQAEEAQAAGVPAGDAQEQKAEAARKGAASAADGGAFDLQALVADGRKLRGGVEVTVQERTLRLTNLDKALYPQTGFTKGDLIAYYGNIAPVLLPHLRGRPLTLKRYPDGVEGEHFYEKQCPSHRPPWVQTTAIYSGRNERDIDYCRCEDLPTLIWLGNLAALELHPSLSPAETIERPTTLAFDLDPGAPAGIVQCAEVALLLHEMLAELNLRAFVKTSGLKGVQVYVPLNESRATYAQTKPFARAVAQLLARRHPKLVVWRMDKARRAGRVLIDWSQNDQHKTTVAVYSPRAGAAPTVSAPLDWGEVSACCESGDARSLQLSPEDVLARVRAGGDLFAQVATLRQALPALGE